MKHSMAALAAVLIASTAPLACAQAVHEMASNVADPGAIDGGSRNVMRTAEGALIGAFVKLEHGKNALYFSNSGDDGKTWYSVSPGKAGQSADALYPAVDSNFNGAYLAFVDKGGDNVGRIAFSPNPLDKRPRFEVSNPVTPKLSSVRGSFVAASRVGWGDKPSAFANTVAYGWTDAGTGDVYVGVSPDGKSFPEAKKVLTDSTVRTGPAVTIHGDYVFVLYLSGDPAMAPADLPGKSADAKYPVWVESRDLGKTWSSPAPLFGRSIADFPRIKTATVKAGGGVAKGQAYAAGGSPDWLAATLVWETHVTDKTGGIVFAVSSLGAVTPDGATPLDPGNLVGVVSFRPLKPGSAWTHVIANHDILRSGDAENRIRQLVSPLVKVSGTYAPSGMAGVRHQYSALVDTPVRATSYVQRSATTGQAMIAVVASSDTGKSFDHFKSFSEDDLKALGVAHFDSSMVMNVSQCLFEGRNGDVYVDALIHDSRGTGAIQHVKLPLDINANELRQRESLARSVASN